MQWQTAAIVTIMSISMIVGFRKIYLIRKISISDKADHEKHQEIQQIRGSMLAWAVITVFLIFIIFGLQLIRNI